MTDDEGNGDRSTKKAAMRRSKTLIAGRQTTETKVSNGIRCMRMHGRDREIQEEQERKVARPHHEAWNAIARRRELIRRGTEPYLIRLLLMEESAKLDGLAQSHANSATNLLMQRPDSIDSRLL